jgi:transcriptional regulator with XRE-family HTH domain
MPGQRFILKPGEAEAFASFVAYASSRWAESQTELASRAGVSPGMVSAVISKKKKAGGRTLRGVSTATGIPSEEILSGVGLEKLKSLQQSGDEKTSTEARVRAMQALSLLYDASFDDVVSIFKEIGSVLPSGATATTWFDVGRAAIERRRSCLPLTIPRILSP